MAESVGGSEPNWRYVDGVWEYVEVWDAVTVDEAEVIERPHREKRVTVGVPSCAECLVAWPCPTMRLIREWRSRV